MRRWLKRGLLAGGLLLILVLAGLVPVSLAPLRDTLRELSNEYIGVEISISGPLRLRLGLYPSITAGAIEVRAPDRSGAGQSAALATVGSLKVGVRLPDMLRGNLHFDEISAAEIAVDYCASLPQLAANDDEDEDAKSAAVALPSIAANYVNAETLDIYCSTDADGFALELTRITAGLPAEGPATVVVAGNLSELPFSFTAETLSLNKLLTLPPELPISLSGNVASVSADINGVVQGLPDNPAAQAALRVDADDADWLGGLGLADAPQLGALNASAEIAADPQAVSISGLSLSISTVPVLNSPVEISDGKIAVNLLEKSLQLTNLQIQAIGNKLVARGNLETQATCPQFDLSISAESFELAPVAALAASPDTTSQLGGTIESAELSLDSCGTDLESHAKSLAAQLSVGRANFLLDATALPVALDSLQLTTGWTTTTELDMAGTLLDESVTADLNTGTIELLISGAAVPIFLHAEGAGTTLTLEGRTGLGSAISLYTAYLSELLNFPVSEDQPFIEGALRIDTPQVGSLHSWIGVPTDNELSFTVSAGVVVSGNSMLTEEYEIHLGDSDLRGRTDIQLDNRNPELIALVRSSRIDIEQLISLLPETGDSDGEAEPAEPAEPAEKTAGIVTRMNSHLLSDNINMPAIEVDLLIDEITGSPLEITEIAVSGRLVADQIKDALLSLTVEDTPFRGEIDADLSDSRARIDAQFGAENADIDRLLTALGFPGNQDIRVEQISTKISSDGRSIHEIIGKTHLETEIRALHWEELNDDDSNLIIELDRVLLSLGPDQPARLESLGYVNQVLVQAYAETPSVNSLLSDDPIIPFKIAGGSTQYTVILRGSVDRGNPDFLSGTIDVSGEPVFTSAELLPGLEHPLSGFEINTTLRAHDNGTYDSELKVSKGSSSLEGTFNVEKVAGLRSISIDLVAPLIQTDDFVMLAEQWREARELEPDGAPSAAVTPQTAEQQELPEDEGNLLLIVDDFVEAFIAAAKLDLRIEVRELLAGDYSLGNGAMRFQLNEEELRLDPFNIRYTDGEVSITYVETGKGNDFDATLDIEIDNLEIGGLMPLISPDLDFDAVVYFDANLSTKTAEKMKFTDHINGSVRLLAIPEEVDASILDLWASNVIFALLPGSDNSTKVLNCLVAGFDAKDGVLSTKSILLDSTDIIVRGRGTIDIPNQQIDLLASPQAKRERFFSVSAPVRVNGPWDDFQVGLEPGSIVGTLFRWWMSLIYVPFKWLTGDTFPADGLETCFKTLGIELPPEYATGAAAPVVSPQVQP